MKLKILIILLFIIVKIFAQSEYESAFIHFKTGLRDSSLKFKNAVFVTENAFKQNTLKFNDFQENINFYSSLASQRFKNDSLDYDKKDKQKIKKYAAIFRTFTDTTKILIKADTYLNLPFRYDFDDIFGEKRWDNMAVTKLLETKKGNCHSMPFLYKILCEELGVPCYLALACSHNDFQPPNSL